MDKQKILIIGGGGREHAVGWKVAQSPSCGELFFAPGNAGTENLGVNIDIKPTDLEALLGFAKKENIDLTLALPDDPLALGVVDFFEGEGLKIWGPSKNAAKLESSKAFSKNFMKKYNLPTAKFEVFEDFDKAKIYVENHSLPIVIKASGLALGKGVIIAQTKKEAIRALDNILIKRVFGKAGDKVVVEEFLEGPEISIHAFSDGVNYAMFPSSQDHKRVGEGDIGLNTGGMGTIAPVPNIDAKLMKTIEDTIVSPTLEGMKKEDTPFVGVLYPGLILTKDGPKILEYNSRFGDPETESYMRLLDTDLLEIINKSLEQKLNEVQINWLPVSVATIMLASGGYPIKYEKEKIITGINEAEKDKDIIVFHAGTKEQNGNILTNGGRVIGVSAIGKDLKKALGKAYEGAEKINFEAKYYRKDIGNKALGFNS